MSEEDNQPTLMTSVDTDTEDKTEDINHVSTDAVEGEDVDNVEYERPEYFPQNFWSEDDGPDIEGLAKAYSELRTKMSRGDHKAPESYDLSGLEDVAENDPLLSKYTEWAKDNGVSQEAFTDLAKSFLENGVPSDQPGEINLEEERQALGPMLMRLLNLILIGAEALSLKVFLPRMIIPRLRYWVARRRVSV